MCQDDSCDRRHCSKCGGHYEVECQMDASRNGVCEDCYYKAQAEREKKIVAEQFDGNYEAYFASRSY